MLNRLQVHQLLGLILLIAPIVSYAEISNPGIPVTVTQVLNRTLEATAEVRGDLESPATPVVAAEIMGRIIALKVEEGDIVEKGQVLALLDRENYEIALERTEAELTRIEALIDYQKMTVKRFQNLVRQNSSAQNELDRAQTELRTLQAQYKGANAQIKEIRYQLTRTTIVSPVGGMIQRRKVSIGDFVKQGDGLFQIIVVKPLRARLYFPETLVNQIQPGLTVLIQRLGHDESPAKTVLDRLLPMLDPANRGLEGLVEFRNPDGWQPGMSIRARIVLETRQQALLVPALSVVRRPAGEVVYKVVDNKAVQQIVDTGLHENDLVEIRQGLQRGDRVVVDGASFLTNGAALTIRSQTP
jgi:RND family efflux transporter MFP subunit